MGERFTPEQLFAKGYEPDGNGGYRKVRAAKPPEVTDIGKDLAKLYPKPSDDTGNKRVKGATKVEIDGINFDSKTEAFMYSLLKGARIDFAFQKEYIIQERFRYKGEAIRAIKIVVDFELPAYNMIIDTKGYQLADGALKYKMFKRYLSDLPGDPPEIVMPKNKEECQLLLNRLLYDKK